MKALTIRQPWATLIALGVKTIETRSWRAPKALIGERVAIHAGKSWRGITDDITDIEAGWAFVEIDGVYQAGVCLRTSDEGARGDTFMVKGDGSSAAPDVPNDAMPLGAVVAIATLADCLPMANHMDLGDTERIVVGYDTLDHCIPADEDQSAAHGSGFAPEGAFLIRDITDQLPYGHFAVGRWGWMLTDIDQLDEPIRATGKQGVWEWTP